MTQNVGNIPTCSLYIPFSQKQYLFINTEFLSLVFVICIANVITFKINTILLRRQLPFIFI